MIATGLVFVLGALVAALICLLFVPFLWRNAQRLARRDVAATMPASMNEIRAEVDRVRAEAAMNVRRHEMLAQKARERAARERAEVGRLTAVKADLAFLGDQHGGEVNALRGQLQIAQDRVAALEEAHTRLEEENAALRNGFAPADHGVAATPSQTLETGSLAAAPGIVMPAEDQIVREDGPRVPASPPVAATGERSTAEAHAADSARARVAAAAAALVALAGERRQVTGTNSTSQGSPDAVTEADPIAAPSPVGPPDTEPHAGAEPERTAASGPDGLPSESADIRERIADIAARVIQMTSLKEGPGSPIAKFLAPRADSEPAEGPPSLAERVRRLTQPSPATPEPHHNGTAHPPVLTEGELAPSPAAEVAVAQPDPVVSLSRVAKRRRGGARSRPPSPR